MDDTREYPQSEAVPSCPALPSYGKPEPVKAIHKPGILNKMVSKMMKLPKTKMPRMRVARPHHTRQSSKKRPKFY